MKIKAIRKELQQFYSITSIHLPFFCSEVSGIHDLLFAFFYQRQTVGPSKSNLSMWVLIPMLLIFFHLLKDIISIISPTFSCTELILLANNHGVISRLLKLKAFSVFSIVLQLLTHFFSFLIGNVLQKKYTSSFLSSKSLSNVPQVLFYPLCSSETAYIKILLITAHADIQLATSQAF